LRTNSLLLELDFTNRYVDSAKVSQTTIPTTLSSANKTPDRIYNKNAIITPPIPTSAAPSTLALKPSPALFDELGVVALPVPVAVTLALELVDPFVGVAVMVKLLLMDPVTLALVVIVVFATVIVLVILVVDVVVESLAVPVLEAELERPPVM
jgi:hypothetical protein